MIFLHKKYKKGGNNTTDIKQKRKHKKDIHWYIMLVVGVIAVICVCLLIYKWSKRNEHNEVADGVGDRWEMMGPGRAVDAAQRWPHYGEDEGGENIIPGNVGRMLREGIPRRPPARN